MKRTLLTATILTLATTASASHTCDEEGRFFGLVSQSGLDLSGDGIAGRAGNLPVVDSAFRHAGIVIDSELTDPSNPQGNCEPGEIEVTAWGTLTLTTPYGRHALFAQVDTSQTLCYGLVPEVVHLDIVGGRGHYDGASGSIEATLPDDVVLGVDAYGLPTVVYVHDATFRAWVD